MGFKIKKRGGREAAILLQNGNMGTAQGRKAGWSFTVCQLERARRCEGVQRSVRAEAQVCFCVCNYIMCLCDFKGVRVRERGTVKHVYVSA